MTEFYYMCVCEGTEDLQTTIQSNRETYTFCDGRFELLFEGVLFPKKKKCIADPETYIAALFSVYGVHAFSMVRGQFSFVIWDHQEHVLYGVRDPFGSYPLYYRETENGVLHISSAKRELMNQMDEPNPEALQHFFSFQYVPDPLSMTKGIQVLQAGHYMKKKWNEPVENEQYFHAMFTPKIRINERDVVGDIGKSIRNAVFSRVPEDQSVGVFLSGGIDSSLVAALAKEESSSLQAFSVGFAEEGYSEIASAKRTAQMLGIPHHIHVITVKEFIDVLPDVISVMEDPIADPSCIPLYIAAREAKKNVDVILSGEGADELFGGYSIYREHDSIKLISQLPDTVQRMIRRVATVIPEGIKGKSYLLRASTPLEQRYIGNAKIFEEQTKRHFLYGFNPEKTYEQRMVVLYEQVQHAHPTEKMQYIDVHTWLPGNILAKARAMATAHGLDVRMPFLDVDVFALAKQIPVELKIRNQTTKYVLRQAAKGIAPDHVIEQRKLGFPVPLRKWLKNELYDWAMAVIDQSETDDLIDHQYARDLVQKHAIGKIDYSRKIWALLTFMMWYDQQKKWIYEQEDLLFGT